MKVVATGTNYSKYCSKGKRMLEDYGFTVVENETGQPLTQEEAITLAYDADAIIAGVDIWNEKSFKACPNVKIIVRFGVGYDNFDMEAATKHGIKMCNAKAGNATAVAECAVSLMLAAYKHTCGFNESVRKGIWDRTEGYLGNNLCGKKVGLVGFGAIAQKVAKMLTGFDVELLSNDMYPNKQKAKELNVSMVNFDEIIKKCDIISIHVPNIPSTKHLFHKEIFEKMKSNAVLINTARGPIVNENDLYDALKNKTIAYAGIDVFEEEPTSGDSPLFTLDNIVVSPHIAAETYETYHDIGVMTAQMIIDNMEGKIPANLLNPNVVQV